MGELDISDEEVQRLRDGCGRIPRAEFVIIQARVTKSPSHDHITSIRQSLFETEMRAVYVCALDRDLSARLLLCRHAAMPPRSYLFPKSGSRPSIVTLEIRVRPPALELCNSAAHSNSDNCIKALGPLSQIRRYLADLGRPWPCAVLLQSALCCVLLSLSQCRVVTLGRV